MSKTEEKLEIEVVRTWPRRRLKRVRVSIEGKDKWHNDITLSKEQAAELHKALEDIIGENDEV